MGETTVRVKSLGNLVKCQTCLIFSRPPGQSGKPQPTFTNSVQLTFQKTLATIQMASVEHPCKGQIGLAPVDPSSIHYFTGIKK